MTNDLEHAVTEYLGELEAEAELAREDLAELEDHMRSLVEELRATGSSSEHAIAEAKLRLGDPRTIAREHARVRSPFGAKLSRARARSAGGLFVALVLLNFAVHSGGSMFSGYFVIETMIGLVLGGALIARLSWARGVVAGFTAYSLLHLTITVIAYGGIPLQATDYSMIVVQLGVLAFVMPWRRGEIGPAGYALALVCVMYMGTTWLIAFEQLNPVLTPEGIAAHVGHLVTSLAGVGIVMRARWAALMAALAAASLAFAGGLVFEIGLPPGSEGVRAMLAGTVLAGALAAVICTRLSWRTARTVLGSLRGFAS